MTQKISVREAPLPIMAALHIMRQAIGRGNIDPEWDLRNVEEGYIEIRWLNKKGCYRLTMDFDLEKRQEAPKSSLYQALQKFADENDYCLLCDMHPSHGHADFCLLKTEKDG